ncbi:hypothetical protein KAU85_00335, partial [Candidatus Bathyarchaeota archaeon]|nr:hypothetical protein [Candidatus Bathyarchaeota archaeon]
DNIMFSAAPFFHRLCFCLSCFFYALYVTLKTKFFCFKVNIAGVSWTVLLQPSGKLVRGVGFEPSPQRRYHPQLPFFMRAHACNYAIS